MLEIPWAWIAIGVVLVAWAVYVFLGFQEIHMRNRKRKSRLTKKAQEELNILRSMSTRAKQDAA